jgi:hypothetical protein
MAEEQNKKPIVTDEQKKNMIKNIISFASEFMKKAFSKGNNDTVWYKKGAWYVITVVLGAVVYAFTFYGIEIIDWVTALLSNLF